MLPSSLLITRSRTGTIRPVYVPLDERHITLATELIQTFHEHVAKRKGELYANLEPFEELGFDYRLVRGLCVLLERGCSFEAHSHIEPRIARRAVFQEANKQPLVVTEELKRRIFETVASTLGISSRQLAESLWSDLDDVLVLKEFGPIAPIELLKRYNLSLTQTLLFKAVALDITVGEHFQQIFRRIKYLGLMYSVEKSADTYTISVDGPVSLFKMTDKYGTSLAKLLPDITASRQWSLKGKIVVGERHSSRLLQLNLDSSSAKDLFPSVDIEPGKRVYDSSVEAGFARSFTSLRTGWRLTREPEPLAAGHVVMIPDFSFEKGGITVFLEIVGFWTEEYLKKKLQKLKQLDVQHLIIAADKSLNCSPFRELKGQVIFYDKKVPLKPIVEYLKKMDVEQVAKQSAALEHAEITLHDDIVEMQDLAELFHTSAEAVKQRMIAKPAQGYRIIGDALIREQKLSDISTKLDELNDDRLSKALKLIEAEGAKAPFQILQALKFTVEWHGLDQDKATIKRAVER
jgi:predicted nuclease of restriction endonuclease-like RecB superfamily